MSVRHRLFPLALLVPAAAPAAPFDPVPVLECREAPAHIHEAGALGAALAEAADCRARRYVGGDELECRPRRALAAFGLPVRDFSLCATPDGSLQVVSVFRTDLQRLRAAVERRTRALAEPQGADGYRLALEGGQDARIGLREDGVSEVSCLVPAARMRPDAARDGVDAAHGAIEGRIAHPVRPTPPMRVCAVPVQGGGYADSGYCALTGEGVDRYRIGDLPPGEYVVLAWPRDSDPNGLVAAHARPLENCAPEQTGCAGGLLERVYVHADELLRGIATDQIFTDLPAGLRRPPHPR